MATTCFGVLPGSHRRLELLDQIGPELDEADLDEMAVVLGYRPRVAPKATQPSRSSSTLIPMGTFPSCSRCGTASQCGVNTHGRH